MAMPGWLWPLAVVASVVIVPTANAQQQPLTDLMRGLPVLGSGLDEVRSMDLPTGLHILCESDPDVVRLAGPALLGHGGRRASTRIQHCTVVGPGRDDALVPATLPSLAGPARLWFLFVEHGGGGHLRLARITLSANRSGWDRVAAALGRTLGEPSVSGGRLITWETGQNETMMLLDPKDPDDFVVAVADLRLRKLLKSPGSVTRPAD